MASVSLDLASVVLLKNSLRSEFPDAKSAHVTEALAHSLGFRTHAALLAAIGSSDEDPPFVLLDTERMLSRLEQFGYARDPEFDFELMDIKKMPDVISTTCHHADEYEYKSPRARAWRNLMVCTVNAGLERRLFSLRENDNRFAEPTLFDFTLPDGTAVRGYVSAISYGELAIYAAVNPRGDHIRNANAGFRAGDAFAHTWLERKLGAWIQSSMSQFSCRKALVGALAALDVNPLGYGDRGRIL